MKLKSLFIESEVGGRIVMETETKFLKWTIHNKFWRRNNEPKGYWYDEKNKFVENFDKCLFLERLFEGEGK